MFIAIWLLALLLLGLWTAAAWGLASLLGTDGAWVAKAEPWLHKLPFGDWLETWFPQWIDVAHALLEALQALLGWLGGMGPVLVWALWAVGALVLLLLAGLISLVVVAVRRNLPPPQPPQPPNAPPAGATTG
jgi:hypothetical protein